MAIFAKSLYASLIWAASLLWFVIIALLMQYVESNTDILCSDISVIGDRIPISGFE
jgi:hypothetical protein